MNETTICERETNDDVGLCDIASTHVDGTQDESGEGESAETQGSRVCKFATFDGLVQTGLELTTEGRQTRFGGIDLGQGTIAKAGSGRGDLMLLAGHGGMRGSIRGV